MRSMRPMKALFVLSLAAAGVWASALTGSASARRPIGLEAPSSASWPKVAAQLAKNIAHDSFTHDYTRVWKYLHPTYQQAISQSHWNRCQGSHPAAPRGVTITKISVASATELPLALALLGHQNVQEIQLLVQFKLAAVAGPQYAVQYTFWLKQGTTWTAVWPSDEYQAYKSGSCYVTPQGPPLY